MVRKWREYIKNFFASEGFYTATLPVDSILMGVSTINTFKNFHHNRMRTFCQVVSRYFGGSKFKICDIFVAITIGRVLLTLR